MGLIPLLNGGQSPDQAQFSQILLRRKLEEDSTTQPYLGPPMVESKVQILWDSSVQEWAVPFILPQDFHLDFCQEIGSHPHLIC